MNKLFTTLKSMLVAFATLFLISCDGPTPNIVITSPAMGREYYKDEDISVEIIITDDKGKTSSLQLFADGKFFDELSAKPYIFSIPAGILDTGKHVLKVVAETESGKQAENVREIFILNEKMESDDFVTFRSGIPPEWRTVGWKIDDFGGVVDRYWVSTNVFNNYISTSKNCNKIEFYLRGLGEVQFIINGILFGTINLGNESSEQGWERFEFTFPTGLHTFTWKYIYQSLGSAGLDAIRFSTTE